MSSPSNAPCSNWLDEVVACVSVVPYYRDDAVVIFNADCRKIVPQIPKACLLLTDPPYGINYNTDSRRFSRKASPYWENTDTSRVSNKPRVVGDKNKFNPDPWIAGPAILWGANHYADRLPCSGGWLVWDKRKGAEEMAEKGWPLSEAELAWTNIRGSVRIFRNLWAGLLRSSEKGEHYHPTQKPLELMAWCIGLAGDVQTILDPFAGSGTTGRAAKDLGRKAVLIEREERYCEIAAKRMAQEVLPIFLEETHQNSSVDNDDLINVSNSLSRQTGDKVRPDIDSIFSCFLRHCFKQGYEPHIFDDGYIGAFESAQELLIAAGKIQEENCIRT